MYDCEINYNSFIKSTDILIQELSKYESFQIYIFYTLLNLKQYRENFIFSRSKLLYLNFFVLRLPFWKDIRIYMTVFCF